MEYNYRKLSFSQAHELLEANPHCIIIDVREEEEYITGHAAGAILFPLDSINDISAMERIPSLDTPLLIYCRSGRRSQLAAYKLLELGYTEVYDMGSLVGWPYGMEW